MSSLITFPFKGYFSFFDRQIKVTVTLSIQIPGFYHSLHTTKLSYSHISTFSHSLSNSPRLSRSLLHFQIVSVFLSHNPRIFRSLPHSQITSISLSYNPKLTHSHIPRVSLFLSHTIPDLLIPAFPDCLSFFLSHSHSQIVSLSLSHNPRLSHSHIPRLSLFLSLSLPFPHCLSFSLTQSQT